MATSLPQRRAPALSRPLVLAGLALLLAVVAVGGWWAGAWLRPYAFHGLVLQSPEVAPGFVLTDQRGQTVSLDDLRGKLVLLFFGYTACPDTCGPTLATLRHARAALGEQADQVQVVMITVDPQRDRPAALGEYLAHFDPSFLGLTGAADQLARVSTLYGVYFAQRPVTDTALGYKVDHTTTVMAIDRQGYLRLVFPVGVSSDDIAADLRYLLRR